MKTSSRLLCWRNWSHWKWKFSSSLSCSSFLSGPASLEEVWSKGTNIQPADSVEGLSCGSESCRRLNEALFWWRASCRQTETSIRSQGFCLKLQISVVDLQLQDEACWVFLFEADEASRVAAAVFSLRGQMSSGLELLSAGQTPGQLLAVVSVSCDSQPADGPGWSSYCLFLCLVWKNNSDGFWQHKDECK